MQKFSNFTKSLYLDVLEVFNDIVTNAKKTLSGLQADKNSNTS